MATFGVQSQERLTNIDLLNDIITDSVTKIGEIDAALEQLVAGGLKGSAVETMSATYIKNRETISDLIKVFASYSVELKEQEERLTKLNTQAGENAIGTPIQ